MATPMLMIAPINEGTLSVVRGLEGAAPEALAQENWVRLAVSGAVGTAFVVESSPDLTHWSPAEAIVRERVSGQFEIDLCVATSMMSYELLRLNL